MLDRRHQAHVPRSGDTTPDTASIDEPGLIESLNRPLAHVGVVTGYIAVAVLLVLVAVWRRRVEQRVPESSAARVVPAGLVATAGALTLGYGWKGPLAIYLPGGMDSGGHDVTALYIYYMLNDFGGYIGWLGVVISAGGLAWMALWERTVSRWDRRGQPAARARDRCPCRHHRAPRRLHPDRPVLDDHRLRRPGLRAQHHQPVIRRRGHWRGGRRSPSFHEQLTTGGRGDVALS